MVRGNELVVETLSKEKTKVHNWKTKEETQAFR